MNVDHDSAQALEPPRRADHPFPLVIVAGGGIGSFTTFSTWILDSHRLAEAGHTHLVWLNLGLSLVAGFAAVVFGHWLGGAV
jgi:fluoride exporter